MKRRLFFPFLVSVFAITFFSFTGEQDPLRKKYAETITAADLKKHLSIIASDSFEGRETGTRGLDMTATYIAQQFNSFGIPPYPHESAMPNPPWPDYFQIVPLLKLTPGNGSVLVGETKYEFGKDFYYTPGVLDAKVSLNDIVFAGYGIQDSLYQDYCCSGVVGKAEMFLADEPRDKKGNSIITGKKQLSDWSTQRRKKITEAKLRGAAAILIIVPDFHKRFEDYKSYIQTPTLELDEEKTKTYAGAEAEEHRKSLVPVIYISKEMADAIFIAGAQKQTTDKIIKKISKTKQHVHFEFSVPLTIEIERQSEKLHSENVLGYIEGTDLKNELVIVTAHMDHLGKDSLGVFNGADDDGSGTVSVLEMAQAFAMAKKDGHGPRRSILFMTVTGEEKGLLGSKWYTDNPVFPLANTVVDLNIDMIGRVDKEHLKDSNYVYVIGSDRLSSELKTINETQNATYTKMMLDYRYDVPDEPNNYYGRSDHYNFAKNNIPIAFFFNGVHADYHKQTDEVSKINFSLMELRARLVFYDAWEIANKDKRLVVDKK